MALIVEDGTGVSSADTYASLADYKTYAASRYSAPTETDAALEAALRRSFDYLNGLNWYGAKTLGRSQVGAFPRSGLSDCDGSAIGSDEIPVELVQAQFELARVEAASPNALSPSGNLLASVISSQAVAGAVSRSFDTSRLTPDEANLAPFISAAMRKISCFLISGGKANARRTDTAVV